MIRHVDWPGLGSVLPCMTERYFQPHGHSHELGQRVGLQLLHNLSPMNLEGDFADAKLGGGLLVEKP